MLYKSLLKHVMMSTAIIAMICYVEGRCFAQEHKEEDEIEEVEKEAPFKPYHQVGLMLGHAHVFEGRDENGNKETLSMPSWGLDYTFNFHPKWAVGLHTDLIMEKFKVEKSENQEIIERSYPIAPALMGIYKPTEHWSILLGMGGEFASGENFVLTRAGIEYGAEISKGWEVFGSVSYDFKWNAYDTWGVGIGISKAFGRPGKSRK